MKTYTKSDIDYCTPSKVLLPGGLTAFIESERDDMTGAPWKECDGHGPVSDWTTRDKRAGERVLSSDRSAKRYYDFAEAMKIAKRDGWGLAGEEKAALAASLGRAPTAGEVRAAAVESDFDFLRGWANDEWQYLVISVRLKDENDREVGCSSIGGVESRGDYWKETAADLLNELLAAHEKETAERAHWEARDTVTVN